ncbi:MAG: secondary thiamine-phosphate synthase enzyme [Thermoleophilia bacterium]|nr:secondary thiamine-phosphate synthase enzyme [Thermoleophilia bacterium]
MTSFTLDTSEHQQFVDITDRVIHAAGDLAGVGALVVASQHTTAAIIVNEGFDPDVTVDLGRALTPLADRDDYDHDEGNSDAHVKVALLGAAQLVPVVDGALALGRWQRIFFCEFDGPRDSRSVVVSRLAGA